MPWLCPIVLLLRVIQVVTLYEETQFIGSLVVQTDTEEDVGIICITTPLGTNVVA